MTPQMRELFLKELELNGVNLTQRPWMTSECVVSEIADALMPEVHEGKISPFGLIFAEKLEEYQHCERISLSPDKIETARKLADGIEWFLLFHQDQFVGLIRFHHSILSDLALIGNFPPSGGTMLQRNSYGEIRFFQGDELIIHDNRRWTSKPSIKEAVWKISKCVPGIDKRVLNRILEFSFFVLSPTSRLGAILVWFLKDRTLKNHNLLEFNLSIMQETHLGMIKHFLSQVDGATYLSPDGKLLNTGAHLKVSEASRKIIQPFKGTRHTSAVRFSYDIEDAIVVTISEDGPVTVFFHGASIADLQIHSVYQKTRDLREHQGARGVQVKTFELVCAGCRKTSLIEEITLHGYNSLQTTQCTTCKMDLCSIECYSLESRPYKKIA